MSKSLILTFWSLVGVFLFIVGQFFIPVIKDLFMGSELFLVPLIVFACLGLALLLLAVKRQEPGALKKFLILTGASATGFFIGVFLHNAFYALAVVTEQITLLNYLMEALHVAFFLMAIIICPLGFLVGLIGSIILYVRTNNFRNNSRGGRMAAS